MKVFISWSGKTSHQVACVLRDWLGSVIQAVEPFVSSEDIDKGTRWSSDIATQLENCGYGIICLTKSNIEAPWIQFEAGALSKKMTTAKVAPFLFKIHPSDLGAKNPLVQFQATTTEKKDVFKLLASINTNIAAPETQLSAENLKKAFDNWWPSLERELAKISTQEDESSGKSRRPDREILEEILETVRSINRKRHGSEERFKVNVSGPARTRLFEELKAAIQEDKEPKDPALSDPIWRLYGRE